MAGSLHSAARGARPPRLSSAHGRWGAWGLHGLCGLAALVALDGACYRRTAFCESSDACPAGYVCGADDRCEPAPDLAVGDASVGPAPIDGGADARDGAAPAPAPWSRALPGATIDAVAVAADGTVIIAGAYAGRLDLGCAVAPQSTDGDDAYVAALSSDGKSCRWLRPFNGAGRDVLQALALSSDSVAAVGSANGRLQLRLLKLSDGADRWSRVGSGGRLNVGGTALAQNGDLFVAGELLGATDLKFDGMTPPALTGLSDLFVARYAAADGGYLWSRQVGGTSTSGATALALEPGGDVLIAGTFANTIDLGGGALIAGGLTNAFLARYDGNNRHVYSLRVGGSGTATAAGLALDRATADPMLVGFCRGTVELGATPLSCAGADWLHLRLGAQDRAVKWRARLGGNGEDEARAIAADPRGGELWIAGSFSDSVSDMNGKTFSSAGERDVLLARLKTDGTLLGLRSYGGAGADRGVAVAAGADGAVVLVGSITGAVAFDDGMRGVAGQQSAFVLRLPPSP